MTTDDVNQIVHQSASFTLIQVAEYSRTRIPEFLHMEFCRINAAFEKSLSPGGAIGFPFAESGDVPRYD
jgi:hypothetical protein